MTDSAERRYVISSDAGVGGIVDGPMVAVSRGALAADLTDAA